MSAITDHDIANAMIRYGGSFVEGLGALYFKADDLNRHRLRAAFSDYWCEYRQIVASQRELHARIPERSRTDG